jgi:tetratricopeptide (TPR) repeat protein
MEILEKLLERHLLVEENQKYRLTHAKIQEVLYQELRGPWRQRWHLCAAQALEAIYATNTEEQYTQLAHHYFEAGKWKDSLNFALKGVKQAVPAYHNEEGLGLAKLALQACDALERCEHNQAMINIQRFDVLAQRVEIYALQGLRERQAQDITKMEMLAESLEDKHKQAIALQKKSELNFRVGKYPEAKEAALKASKLHQENTDQEGQATCLTTIGNICRNLGNYKEALQYHQQALQIRKNLADRQGEAISLGNIGIVHSNLGQHHEALNCLQESLRITEGINDKRGQAINLGNLGAIWTTLGKYTEALGYFEKHLRIAKEIGDRLSQGLCLDNIGIIYSNVGNYEDALAHFKRALQIRQETGDRRGQAISLGNLGTLLTVLGEYKKAWSYHQQDLAIANEIGDRRGQAVAICNLGIVLLCLGDLERAMSNFRKSLKIATEIEDRMSQAVNFYNLGNTYLQTGKHSEAIASYKKAQTVFEKLGAKAEYLECLSAEGLAKLENNQLDDALALSSQAIKLLEAGHICERPQDIYFAHYRILSAHREKEETLIYLEHAYNTVMQRAQAIKNKALRESFLGNVKRNQEIVEAWRSRERMSG